MNKNYYVTYEGYQKLVDEIQLQDKLYSDIEKEMGNSAKRDNDLRENPEYMELRVKAMYGIPAKKKELLQQYQSAVIIEETPEYINWDGETVIRKCTITIDYDGDVLTYTILGENEGDIMNGFLSCEAALVQALLGKKVGEQITFNGCIIKILSVKKVDKDIKVLKNIKSE
jgi:transcription elongation GreA/GreB family factor